MPAPPSAARSLWASPSFPSPLSSSLWDWCLASGSRRPSETRMPAMCCCARSTQNLPTKNIVTGELWTGPTRRGSDREMPKGRQNTQFCFVFLTSVFLPVFCLCVRGGPNVWFVQRFASYNRNIAYHTTTNSHMIFVFTKTTHLTCSSLRKPLFAGDGEGAKSFQLGARLGVIRQHVLLRRVLGKGSQNCS